MRAFGISFAISRIRKTAVSMTLIREQGGHIMLRKLLLSAGAFAMLTGGIVTTAYAQGTPDHRTFFTFSQPIHLPSVTLPAGTYLFRFADASHNVVQVLSKDGKNSYGLFFAIPSERPDVALMPEVQFHETPAGWAPAVKAWWYPGERTGHELIYPKEQAERLAEGGSQPAPTTQAQATAVRPRS
jgi:hypothetical protein